MLRDPPHRSGGEVLQGRRGVRRALVAGALSLLITAGCGGGSSGGPSYNAKPVTSAGSLRLVKVGDFDTPTYVAGPPGDPSRLMVVEQGGRILVVRNGRT